MRWLMLDVRVRTEGTARSAGRRSPGHEALKDSWSWILVVRRST